MAECAELTAQDLESMDLSSPNPEVQRLTIQALNNMNTTVEALKKKYNKSPQKDDANNNSKENLKKSPKKFEEKKQHVEVELLCSGIPPSVGEDAVKMEAYLKRTMASKLNPNAPSFVPGQKSFKNVKASTYSDFTVKSIQKQGGNKSSSRDTKVVIVCDGHAEARKVVHETNKQTGNHKIRAQLGQPSTEKPPPRKLEEDNTWRSTAVKKFLAMAPVTNLHVWPKSESRSELKASDPAAQNSLNKPLKESRRDENHTAQRPPKKLKGKKRIVELVCGEYPGGEAENQVKNFLKELLGSSSRVRVNDLDVESVMKEGSKTRIKVICPSGHQAESLFNEVNMKTKVHQVTASKKIQLDAESPSLSKENLRKGHNGSVEKSPNGAKTGSGAKTNEKKKDRRRRSRSRGGSSSRRLSMSRSGVSSESSEASPSKKSGASVKPSGQIPTTHHSVTSGFALTSGLAVVSGLEMVSGTSKTSGHASQSNTTTAPAVAPGISYADAQRKRVACLRKMTNISSVALKTHYDKISERRGILHNLEKLNGTGLEHYPETITTKIVHQQKLEELEKQGLEFEACWSHLLKMVNEVCSKDDGQNELDKIVEVWRNEAKKLKQALPIYACKSHIISTVLNNDYVVLLGETGSGKSTQTPQYLSDSDLSKRGLIACIQPRQVAAVSLACQVAKEMGAHVGGLVGYKAGYNSKVGPDTKIVYTTNHAMLKEIIKDPLLKEYSCLLVDEAHERSIYCDLLLGMIKEAKRKRPDLRVVVMSATIDPKLFVDYFDGCPIVKVSGRTFPVELEYKTYDDGTYGDNYLREAVDKAKQVHQREPPGDILVFLTSPAEIEKAVQDMGKERGALSLPLHGRLQPDQQKLVFNPTPHGTRKIVFATNAAETSITIPGIRYVIDTGKAKEMSFDSTRGISSLDVQWISRSSADQRKGRAGRIESGKCYRLYSEDVYNAMSVGSVPEILKSSTEMAFLTLMTLGINDPTKFDFVEAPSKEVMAHAMTQLLELGAILPEGGLTELGQKLAKLNLEPKYGKLLLQAVEYGFGFDGMVITALLTVGSSIFFRMGSPSEKQMADKLKTRFCSPKGDIYTTYEVFKEWYAVPKNRRNGWCMENSINAKSLRMCLDFVNELSTTLKKELNLSVDLAFSPEDIHDKMDSLLLLCYRKNLARYTGHSKTGYYVPHLRSAVILHPSSSLQMLKEEPTWIVFANVLETGRKYLLNPTAIDADLVNKLVDVDTTDTILAQMKSQYLEMAQVYAASVGQTILARFIGPRGQNIQRLQSVLQEEYLGDIPFALDVSVASCQLNFFCSPDISEAAVGYVESELTKLKDELVGETIEKELIPNSDVYYVLEEGCCFRTVLMAEEFRAILVKTAPHGISDKQILDLFSKYGKILRHFVFKRTDNPRFNKNKSDWGKIVFEDESVAKQVMHRYRMKSDVELGHFTLAPEERRMSPSLLSTNLSFSWARRLCTGLGFLTFDSADDASEAYLKFSLNSLGFIVRLSRKNNNELALNSVPSNMDEDGAKKLIDPIIPGVNYQVRLVRQRVDVPTEAEVSAKRQALIEKIRDETLETNFQVTLPKPKEKNFTWFGYIKTSSAEVAEKIYDICNKSIDVDGCSVSMELKLSGQLPLNQRLYQKLQRQYDGLIAEATVKFQHAQLWLEQGRYNGLQYLKIQAPDATAFTEISKMCNELVFGSLIPVPNGTGVDVLGSVSGRKFLGTVEQQLQCVVQVDRAQRGVRVFANERIREQVKERVEQFLENNCDRINRRIELTGEEKPKGVMKYLIKNYGVSLQLFIAKTKVDNAEIVLRDHALVLTGTNETVTAAIEEVEKASKALLENQQDDAASFTDDCPICLCPITEKIYYTERCGHAYCYDCVKAMLVTAGNSKEVPITCAKENCGEKIAVKDITNIFHLNDDAYKSLVEAALDKYVINNKEKVKHCLTPDCKMVYKVSLSKNKIFECPSCFAKMCRSCHSPSHEGLPCDTYKLISSDEDKGVAEWLKENKLNRCLCPKCNALIEKNEGCNHMQCYLCKIYFCWVCKKSYASSGDTYTHLSSTHGGPY